MLDLPSKKQINLMTEIYKKGFISANFKNNLYHNYYSTFRALEDLVKKTWLLKQKNKINENVYLLSKTGNNLLVVIGFLEEGKFIILE